MTGITPHQVVARLRRDDIEKVGLTAPIANVPLGGVGIVRLLRDWANRRVKEGKMRNEKRGMEYNDKGEYHVEQHSVTAIPVLLTPSRHIGFKTVISHRS